MDSEKEAFVREVERLRDEWVSLSVRVLRGGELVTMDSALEAAITKAHSVVPGALSAEEVRLLMLWSLGGLAHSLLTMLDGGTMLADEMRVSLLGPSGDELTGGLHELISE